MENKVYCKLCKHVKYVECGGYDWYECKSNPSHHDDYLDHYLIKEKCIIKNRNNDCTDYEASRSWFELINFIKFPII